MTTTNSPFVATGLATGSLASTGATATSDLFLIRLHIAQQLAASLFTAEERRCAAPRIVLTDDAPQLQRWQRNIVRVQQAREAAQHAQTIAERARRGRTSD